MFIKYINKINIKQIKNKKKAPLLKSEALNKRIMKRISNFGMYKCMQKEFKSKIIIAGSRNCPENSHDLKERVFRLLSNIGLTDIEIVSGGCHGADKFGEWFANLFNIPIKQFPADWSLGKKAGPIRNKQMAEYGTNLIAIWDGQSKGTTNMIDLAKQYGLEIRIIRI